MGRTQKDEPNAPKGPKYPSPCHPDAELHSASLFAVGNDGEIEQIGRAWYCGLDRWDNGNHKTCSNLASVTPKKFQPILGDNGPGYWMEHGYHIVYANGAWRNLADFDYLPPGDGSKWTPRVHRIVEIARKMRNSLPTPASMLTAAKTLPYEPRGGETD